MDAELVYQRGLPPQSQLYLQACPDPGGRLSVAAEEHAAALPSADCAGVGGAVSRDRRDATRTAGASLHRGGPWSRLFPTGSGPASAPGSARLIRKPSVTSRKDWRCSRPCRTPLSVPSKSSTCRLALGQALTATKGQAAPDVGHVLQPGARAVPAGRGDPASSSGCCLGCLLFHLVRAELQTARELSEELLTLAQHIQDPTYLLGAHWTLGGALLLPWGVCPCPRAS